MNGIAIGRGLVNYSADEIRAIKGCKSSEIEARLGKKEFDEVIHRDNLVVL
jgi:glutamate 5-kinase